MTTSNDATVTPENTADAAPKAAEPTQDGAPGWRVQLKASLRGMGFEAQQAALAPGAGDPETNSDIAARGLSGASSPVDSTAADAIKRATGVDVSHAQIHTGPEAVAAANEMGAEGYTLGNHVALASDSESVKFHELGHVAQQDGVASDNKTKQPKVGPSQDLEAEADTIAHAAMTGGQAHVTSLGTPKVSLREKPDGAVTKVSDEAIAAITDRVREVHTLKKGSIDNERTNKKTKVLTEEAKASADLPASIAQAEALLAQTTDSAQRRQLGTAIWFFKAVLNDVQYDQEAWKHHLEDRNYEYEHEGGRQGYMDCKEGAHTAMIEAQMADVMLAYDHSYKMPNLIEQVYGQAKNPAAYRQVPLAGDFCITTKHVAMVADVDEAEGKFLYVHMGSSGSGAWFIDLAAPEAEIGRMGLASGTWLGFWSPDDAQAIDSSGQRQINPASPPANIRTRKDDKGVITFGSLRDHTLAIGEVVDLLDEETGADGTVCARIRRASGGVFWTASSNLTEAIDRTIVPESTQTITISKGGGAGTAQGGGGQVGHQLPTVDTHVDTSHAQLESEATAGHGSALDATSGLDACDLEAKQAWDADVKEYRDLIKHRPDDVAATANAPIDAAVEASGADQAAQRSDQEQAATDEAVAPLEGKKLALFKKKRIDKKKERLERLGLTSKPGEAPQVVGLVDGVADAAHPADRQLILDKVQRRLNAWYFGEGGDAALDTKSPEDTRAAVALMTQDLTNRLLSGRIAQEFLGDVAEYWSHFQTEKLAGADRRQLKKDDREAFDAYKDDRKLTRTVERKHSDLGKAGQTVAALVGKDIDPGASPDDVAALVATGQRGPEAIEPHLLNQAARTPDELAGGAATAHTVAARVDQVDNAGALTSAMNPMFSDLSGIDGIPAVGAKAPEPALEPGANEQVSAANLDAAEDAAPDVQTDHFLTVVYQRLVELVLGVHAKPGRDSSRLKDLRVGDRVPVTAESTEDNGRTWAQAIVESPTTDGGAKLGWVDTTFTNANPDREQSALESGDAEAETQQTLLGETPKGLAVIDFLRPLSPGATIPCYGGVYEADKASPVAEIGGTDDASLLALTGQTADNDPDLLEVLVGGQPVYAPRTEFRVADSEERMIHLDTLSVEEIQQVRKYAATIPDSGVQAAFYQALQAKPMFLEATRSTVVDVERRGTLTSLAIAFEMLGVPMPYAQAGSYADALEMVRLEKGLPETLDTSTLTALAGGFGVGSQVIEATELQLTLRAGQAVLALKDDQILRVAGVTEEGWLVDDPAHGARTEVPNATLTASTLVALSVSAEVDLGETERVAPELSADADVEKAYKGNVFVGTDESEQQWYLGKSEAVHGDEVADKLKAWVPSADVVYCMPEAAQLKAFYANIMAAGESLDTFVAVLRFVEQLETFHGKAPGKTPAVKAPAAIATMRADLSATVEAWVRQACPTASEEGFRSGHALMKEAGEDQLLQPADMALLASYVDQLLPDMAFDALLDLGAKTDDAPATNTSATTSNKTPVSSGSGKTPIDAGYVDENSGVGKVMGAMGAKRDFDEIHMDEGESADLTLGFGHWAADGLVGFYEDMPGDMPQAWAALTASVHGYFVANPSKWPSFVADTGLTGSAAVSVGNVDAGLQDLLISKVKVGGKEKSKLLKWSKQKFKADGGIFEDGSTYWFTEAIPAAMNTEAVQRYQVYKWTEQMIDGGKKKASNMDMDESLAGATMGAYLSSSGINKIGWHSKKSDGGSTAFMKDRYGSDATKPVLVKIDDQTVALDDFSYTSKGKSHTFNCGSVPADFKPAPGGATAEEVSEDWRVFVLFQKYRSYYANRKRRDKRDRLESAAGKAKGDPAEDKKVKQQIKSLEGYKTYTRDRLQPVWDDFLSVAWGALPGTAGEVPTQAHSGTKSPRGDVSAEATQLKASMLSGEDVEQVETTPKTDDKSTNENSDHADQTVDDASEGGLTYGRNTWTFWAPETFATALENEHLATFKSTGTGAKKDLLDAVHTNEKAAVNLDGFTMPAIGALGTAVQSASANPEGFTKVMTDTAADTSWARRTFRFACLAADPAVSAYAEAEKFKRALLVAANIGAKYGDIFEGGPIASDDDPVWTAGGQSVADPNNKTLRKGGAGIGSATKGRTGPVSGAKSGNQQGPVVPTGTASGLLSNEELTAAQDFYRGNLGAYPATLVKEIQMLCGCAQTGQLDPATIQSVAQYQKDAGISSDGQAGGGTLTKMFGGDVRLIAKSPPIIVDNEGHERLEGGKVVLTQKIADAWDILEPELPAGTRVTSGYRPWEHQAEIMRDYFEQKKPDLIANNVFTEASWQETMDKRNYKEMQNALGDQRFGMKKYAVAMPGRSKHQSGTAFDICDGVGLGELNTLVHDFAAKNARFGKMFEKTILEWNNGCVHIEVK